MGVSQLGYLVLDVSDIDAWRDLAASIMGAEQRRDQSADLVRLRFDEHHHRITLRPAKTDSVAAIGWEVPSLGELESVRKRVTERGFSITEGTREDLTDRKVAALFRFRDMDGFPLEIYYGPWTDDVPFQPSRPMSGFNCGPLGLDRIYGGQAGNVRRAPGAPGHHSRRHPRGGRRCRADRLGDSGQRSQRGARLCLPVPRSHAAQARRDDPHQPAGAAHARFRFGNGSAAYRIASRAPLVVFLLGVESLLNAIPQFGVKSR